MRKLRETCRRLGLNYIYGLINFLAGVVCGAFVAGFSIGVTGNG